METKQRSLKELFIILRDNIDKLELGLCFLSNRVMNEGLIDEEEESRLKTYIYHNKPNEKSIFYDVYQKGHFHYWHICDKEIRLRWVKSQIRKLK